MSLPASRLGQPSNVPRFRWQQPIADNDTPPTKALPAELKAFVAALPAHIRSKERIVLARAAIAANDGDFDELERLLLDRPFATIREGETLLSDLWVLLRRGRIEAELKRPATVDELKADLKAHPVPRALNLRMHTVVET